MPAPQITFTYTTTTVKLSPGQTNPSPLGVVFFTTTVTSQQAPGHNPSGTIQLFVDGRFQTQRELTGQSQGELRAIIYTVGKHVVTTMFLGNQLYRPSHSPPLEHEAKTPGSSTGTPTPSTTLPSSTGP